MLKTLDWVNNKIKLIDQVSLPHKLKYLHINNIKDLWQAIKTLQVRGAPALGGAAALGVFLGLKDSKAKNFNQFKKELDKVSKFLALSRPTARNLFWAIERMSRIAIENKDKKIPVIKKLLFLESQKIIQEDRYSCRRIGHFASPLIKNQDTILTICNAGILATIDYGTALGVIYSAKDSGKDIKVFALETRPLLQGARLTAWELNIKGVNVTLVADNMAAFLMQKGKINKVIAGADRIALNGDTANKIGTLNLAILSRYHNIPFYIAAPISTFDLSIKRGEDIPIEERDPDEVRTLIFKRRLSLKDAKVFNPAFDVTPHNLITGIITDKGLIKPPFAKNINRLLIK